jgi:sulfhydrogenase subunit beta (sulfur reductase)
MKMITIPKKEWPAGLAKAAGSFRLFGPVKEKEFHSFKRLDNGQLPDFSCLNTRLSPKHLVYPQTEVMLTYSLDESRADHHIMKEAAADTPPARCSASGPATPRPSCWCA